MRFAEQDAARGQIEKARLPLIANPVIEGLGSMKEKSVQDGRGKYTNYGVAVSQEFEVAGQRGLRIDIAEKNYARVGLEIQDRHRILMYEVKTSFANALVSKQRVTLLAKCCGFRKNFSNLPGQGLRQVKCPVSR